MSLISDLFRGRSVDAPVPQDPARDFDTDAQPGARLPHVELRRNDETISTLDLVGPDFLLLAGERGADWVDALGECVGSIPARAIRLGVDVVDSSGSFYQIAGIRAGGCLLVRPDGHVAFRSPSSSAEPRVVLKAALQRAVAS